MEFLVLATITFLLTYVTCFAIGFWINGYVDFDALKGLLCISLLTTVMAVSSFAISKHVHPESEQPAIERIDLK